MRPQTAAAGLLGIIALVLPVQHAAAVLLGADGPANQALIEGIWLFKGLLFVHALIWFAFDRNEVGERAGEPLLAGLLQPAGHASRIELWLLAALLVAAMVVRLTDLGTGLWYDEIETLVAYVRRPLGEIISVYDSQNQHMLYSVLARVMVVMFGESGWALRLPSVLFGVASLAALYWFATLIVDRREALVATALLTFSYHHIWFSQNARGYTGMLFWTLVGSGLFLKLVAEEPRSWKTAVAYAAAMSLGVYTHAMAVLPVLAHALIWVVLMLRRRESRSLAQWLPAIAIVLAGTFTLQLYSLVLPQFVNTLFEPTMEGVATQWKDPWWLLAETVRGLARGLPGGLFAVAIGGAVAAAGFISFARKNAVVAAIMVLPGLITAALLLTLEHNLWPRFFFFSAGFAVLIAIRGLLAVGQLVRPVQGRMAALAICVVALLFNAATMPAAWHPKQDFVSARDYVEGARRPGDAVVTIDMSRYAYQSYVAPDFLGVENEAELEQIERSHQRTWLIYTFPTRLAAVQPEIWSRVQREYKTAAEFPGTVNGGAIVVKVRP